MKVERKKIQVKEMENNGRREIERNLIKRKIRVKEEEYTNKRKDII